MNRGDRREDIFRDDQDRQQWLKTLGEACEKTGWNVHAYCLMSNHFHLVVETPQANLVDGMKWFLGTYTSRFNRRHKEFGHLFSGRYKALVVDGSSNGYLGTVGTYVHLNPARAKLLKLEQPLRDYRWSSYREYLAKPAQRPKWLRVDRLFGESGTPKDSPAGRRHFESVMEERRRKDDPESFKFVGRGWCLGDDDFRRELLEEMGGKLGPHHGGSERQEIAEARAERLLREELAKRGWGDGEMEQRRKGDGEKIKIARRLRAQTTMSWAWIAERLRMGAAGYAANCVRVAK